MLRHPKRIRPHTQTLHHPICRSFDHFASDQRADRNHRRGGCVQRLTNAGNLDNRRNADQRVGRGDDNQISRRYCRNSLGCGACQRQALIVQFTDLGTAARFDKILLKGQPTLIGPDAGLHGLICWQNQPRSYPECSRNIAGDIRPAVALFQAFCTVNMQAKIAVTERHPSVAAQTLKH